MPLLGLASQFYPTPSVFFFWKVGHTPSCGQLCVISPVYTPVGIQGKSPLQGNIRYISLAVPLILEAAMVQMAMFHTAIPTSSSGMADYLLLLG